MTRQKKELIKQIHAISEFIRVDEELGCGFAPANAYQPLEEEQWSLMEKLARLQKYGSAMEMLNDTRGQFEDPNLPF